MTKSIKALSFLIIMSGSFMSEAMEDNSPEAMARKLGLTTQEYLNFLKNETTLFSNPNSFKAEDDTDPIVANAKALGLTKREYLESLEIEKKQFPNNPLPKPAPEPTKAFLTVAPAKTDRLPSLTIVEMEATFGNSSSHDFDLKTEGIFTAMHQDGDNWDPARLQDVFLRGLFQHYTFVLSGFDYTKDNCMYEQWLDSKGKIGKWHLNRIHKLYTVNRLDTPQTANPLLSSDVIKTGVLISRWFKAVADALKQNKTFASLGGDFQKFKVVLEKREGQRRNLQALVDAKKETSEKLEEYIKETLRLDREEIDRQVILFNWMKDIYAVASQVFRDSFNTKKGAVPDAAHPLLDEIKRFHPEYTQRQVYKGLFINK